MKVFNLEIDWVDEPTWRNGDRVIIKIKFANGHPFGSITKTSNGIYELRRASVVPKPFRESVRHLIEALGGEPGRIQTTVNSRTVEDISRDALGFAARLGRASRICAICNRRLTDPESMKRGIGPDCWANIVKGQPDGYISQDLPMTAHDLFSLQEWQHSV